MAHSGQKGKGASGQLFPSTYILSSRLWSETVLLIRSQPVLGNWVPDPPVTREKREQRCDLGTRHRWEGSWERLPPTSWVGESRRTLTILGSEGELILKVLQLDERLKGLKH